MNILNSNERYGLISIIFHWLMALITIATFILGLNLKHNFQYYYEVLALHNSLGITIFLLAILRVTWRFFNIKPAQLPNKVILMKLATLTHIFFYIIFFTLPITGYILTNLQGDIVLFYGYGLPEVLEQNRGLKNYVHTIHDYVGNVLLILFSLHVLGALYHHLIKKDNTLRRITFFKMK
jgi:cytochrome b561